MLLTDYFFHIYMGLLHSPTSSLGYLVPSPSYAAHVAMTNNLYGTKFVAMDNIGKYRSVYP